MRKLSLLLGFVAVAIFAIGCDQPTTSNSGPANTPIENGGNNHDEHDHAAQDHTSPHGGHLIELGRNHEYHAELVDDHQTESITIYMMDSHMEPLSLTESSVSLVLTAGENTKTFELLPSQSGDSSEFSSNEAAMMEMMEGEEVKGKLRVTIDGKPYSGAFDYHDHSHGEESDSHAAHNP